MVPIAQVVAKGTELTLGYFGGNRFGSTMSKMFLHQATDISQKTLTGNIKIHLAPSVGRYLRPPPNKSDL